MSSYALVVCVCVNRFLCSCLSDAKPQSKLTPRERPSPPQTRYSLDGLSESLFLATAHQEPVAVEGTVVNGFGSLNDRLLGNSLDRMLIGFYDWELLRQTK